MRTCSTSGARRTWTQTQPPATCSLSSLPTASSPTPLRFRPNPYLHALLGPKGYRDGGRVCVHARQGAGERCQC
eukprot:908443-Rhodomonas_salina.1